MSLDRIKSKRLEAVDFKRAQAYLNTWRRFPREKQRRLEDILSSQAKGMIARGHVEETRNARNEGRTLPSQKEIPQTFYIHMPLL